MHKRSLTRVLWVLLLALTVTCAVAPSAFAKTTLRVFLYQGDVEELSWMKAALAEFEKENPDVNIEVLTNAGADYITKLTTLWASGSPPDVWDHGGAVRTYDVNGWLLDLSKFVERDKAELNIPQFYQGAWNAYRWGKRIVGIPHMTVGSFVFYNPELFDKAGVAPPPVSWDDNSWTWDKMVEIGRKLTRADGSGKLTQAGVGAGSSSFNGIIYSYLWGGDWFDKEATYQTGLPTKSTLYTPENVNAYTRVVNLARKDHIAPTPEDGFDAWSGFGQHKVGMYLGAGPWAVMGKRKVLNMDWGMAPFPKGKERSSIIYTDPWMISSKTKYPEEAWRLVKFMTSEKIQRAYTQIAMFPPSRKTVTNTYLTRMAQYSGFHTAAQVDEALDGAQKYGVESLDHLIAGWPQIYQKLEPLFTQMFTGKKSVEQTLQEADMALNALYKNRKK